MKTVLLAAATFATLYAGSEMASAAPTFAGVYLGAHAGYEWSDVEYRGPVTTLAFDPDGFVGGVHAGYNWHSNGWIFGVEGDFDYLDNNATDSFGVPDEFDANWEGAILGRAGAILDEYLIYGAVGVSFLDYDWTVSSTEVSDTAVGWTWAFGVEREIGASGVTVRLEYRASNYDEETLDFGGTFRDVEPNTQAVTLGVSFRL